MKKLKLKMLPPMKCDRGCGGCCGIAPATEAEYQKVISVARAKKLVPLHQGITCPFYQDGACQVYDARPFICRLFGHSEKLECDRGYNTNVPEKDVHRMTMAHGKPTRVLHEALLEFGVCLTLEEAVGDIEALEA
jgi:Fe-S-cluster containining protein